MRLLLGLFFIPILLGCNPRVGSDIWLKKTPKMEVKSYYSKICSDYGFKQNSSEMAVCIQREIIAQKERNTINNKRAISASSGSNHLSEKSGFTFSFTKRID